MNEIKKIISLINDKKNYYLEINIFDKIKN